MERRLTLTFYTLLYIYIATAATLPKYEVRAVWLTTIGGIDWPSCYAHDGMGIEQQQRQLTDMLDKLKALNINTVLLQTRIRATTIYPSAMEPWDGCLSGKPGTSPGYDALRFAIDECHRRGMELHAWVVTIPVGKWNTHGCQQLRRRHPTMVRKIGDEGYMNPEVPQTATYIADMCAEITRKYDIDGIHLDYIRYPETWRGAKNAENITRIVRATAQAVRSLKPWVKMSCSPIGKYDDLSRYRSNGWNARRRVAQDAQGWLREGLMDQLYPMMYFRGNQFYPFALDWQENACGRTVAAGLGVYILHPREGNWPLSEIQRQMNFTRQIGMGHCYFRAKFLLENTKGIYDYADYADRHPALVPPMTWRHSLAPLPPARLTVSHTAEGDNLTWQGARDMSGGPYLTYNVYASHEKDVDVSDPANLVATRHQWQQLSLRNVSAAPLTGRQPRVLHYAVTAVDRYGNESRPVYEDATPVHSSFGLLANDGRRLLLGERKPEPSAYLLINSMQGTMVATRPCRPSVDISRLPEGMYELKALTKRGTARRIGFFIVKRKH